MRRGTTEGREKGKTRGGAGGEGKGGTRNRRVQVPPLEGKESQKGRKETLKKTQNFRRAGGKGVE